jgi:hypothetical protein
MNFTTGSTSDELLSLDKIRSTLIRLEDTIIFGELHAYVLVGAILNERPLQLSSSVPSSHGIAKSTKRAPSRSYMN